MNLLAKRIVILLSDGVDEVDLTKIRRTVEREGAEVFTTTALPQLVIETYDNDHRGKEVFIDLPIELVTCDLFDALVVPEGMESIDAICSMSEAISLVREFFDQGKPIVFSGAAHQIVAEQGLQGGRVLCSSPGDTAKITQFILEGSEYVTSTNKTNHTSNRLEKVLS